MIRQEKESRDPRDWYCNVTGFAHVKRQSESRQGSGTPKNVCLYMGECMFAMFTYMVGLRTKLRLLTRVRLCVSRISSLGWQGRAHQCRPTSRDLYTQPS